MNGETFYFTSAVFISIDSQNNWQYRLTPLVNFGRPVPLKTNDYVNTWSLTITPPIKNSRQRQNKKPKGILILHT